MKKLTTLLLALLIPTLCSQAALAQDSNTALVPLPSVDDCSKGKDCWRLGLGFGVEYETAYEGSGKFGLEIEPAGQLQWRQGDAVYFFAGEALG